MGLYLANCIIILLHYSTVRFCIRLTLNSAFNCTHLRCRLVIKIFMNDKTMKHDSLNILIKLCCSLRHYDFWEMWILQYRLNHTLQCLCDCPILCLNSFLTAAMYNERRAFYTHECLISEPLFYSGLSLFYSVLLLPLFYSASIID